MKELKIASSREEYDRLIELRKINTDRALNNPNENLVWDKLLKSSYDREFLWERQYVFGYRIFDFYSPKFKVAVEVDGLEHNKDYDNYRDEYLFRVHGIIVLRCRNQNLLDIESINKFLPNVGKFVYGKRNRLFKDVLGRCSSMHDREVLSEAIPYDQDHSLLGQFLRSKGFFSSYQIYNLKSNAYWRNIAKEYSTVNVGNTDKAKFREQLAAVDIPFTFIKGDFLFSEDAEEIMKYRRYRVTNDNSVVLYKDFSFSFKGIKGEGLDKFLEVAGVKTIDKLVARKANKFIEFGSKDERSGVLGDMSLSEYVQIRCGKSSKALTLRECQLFQIEYKTGWFEKNLNKTVSKQKAHMMLEVISDSSKVNASYRKRIKQYLSTTQP